MASDYDPAKRDQYEKAFSLKVMWVSKLGD